MSPPRHLNIRVHVLVMQQHYVLYNHEYELVLFLTLPYYSKTPKILGKYRPYFIFYYMVYTRLRVTMVAVLRYVSSLLCIILLRVI